MDWHGKDLGENVKEVIANLKGSIRTDDIEFKTYPPEGEEPMEEKGEVKVQPNY